MKKGYICRWKWVSRCSHIAHSAVCSSSQWSQSKGAVPLAAGLMQLSSWWDVSARYPSASPQEHPAILSSWKGLSALPHCSFPSKGSTASSKHQVRLSQGSMQCCLHSTGGWPTCSPVKQSFSCTSKEQLQADFSPITTNTFSLHCPSASFHMNYRNLTSRLSPKWVRIC